MNQDMFNAVIGTGIGPRRMHYTWRDSALYALSVGANKDDLLYTYEKDMKALPTFGLVPYGNGSTLEPVHHTIVGVADPVKKIVIQACGGKYPGGLHMDHELIIHRPINPIEGTFITDEQVTAVYDRGEGKGIVATTKMDIYDLAGRLVCTNKGSHLMKGCGGFGGPALPKSTVEIPDKTPDCIVRDRLSETQNVLSRLNGDTALVHVDPEVATKFGFKAPIMQGLCTLGYACRMGIQAVIPGEPERVTRIAGQMRSICYAGDALELHIWKVDGGIYFRLINSGTGESILDRGVMEYK